MLKPSARQLRPVGGAVDPSDERVDPTGTDVDPTDEELVPMQELLAWRSPEPPEGVHVAVGRLAALLGVAAVAVVAMMLILAVGTEITSVFGRLSGS